MTTLNMSHHMLQPHVLSLGTMAFFIFATGYGGFTLRVFYKHAKFIFPVIVYRELAYQQLRLHD